MSREPALQIRPRLYEAEPKDLAVDLLPLLETVGVEFVAGDVSTVDVSHRRIRLRTGNAIFYARLVVATGSTMRRPRVPGAELAHSIDTQHEAIVFDERLAQVVRTSPQPTIAVVGAGFTGIELALVLRDRIARHGTAVQAEHARIILIDRADVVGRQLGSGPRPAIETALAKDRVELLLAKTITALGPTRVAFADGGLNTDAVVLTTMNRAGSSSINHCARDLHARFSSQATRRQRTVATDVLFCSRVSTRSSSAGSPVKTRRAIFLGCH